MGHRNTVLRSVETPDGQVCVDIFRRPDGSFGFETCRRDPEDPSGWYRIGAYGLARFETADAAWEGARVALPWLDGEVGSGL